MGNWKSNIELIKNITSKLTDIEPKTVSNLLNLLLLFNSFEENINKFNDEELLKIDENRNKYKLNPRQIYLKKYKLEPKYYEDIFDFFKKRYVLNGKINYENFDGLFNADSPRWLIVKIKENLVNGNLLRKEEKLFTCLEISYRFRNNIFHGGKVVEAFDKFNDCYEIIIKFFENILEYSEKRKEIY